MLVKPLLRGHLHQAAFFIALGACAMLISETKTSIELTSISIYSFSLVGLLGISTLYHRPQWDADTRMWFKRADHAAIFLLIAGTATPICWLGLDANEGHRALLTVWLAALFGIIQSFFWVRAPKWVSAGLGIVAGGLMYPFLPAMRAILSPFAITNLSLGGAIYILGAVVYALKKPNPWPQIFGYHEIFHLLVVIAAAMHFLAVRSLI